MTVLCVVRDGGETWIGSDTQATQNGLVRNVGPKWIMWGPWALGVSGDLRAQNILESCPKRLFDDAAGAFDVSDRIRAIMKEYEFDLAPSEGHAPQNCGQNMILANAESAWSLAADFSFCHIGHYWADGSGKELALGTLHAGAAENWKPEKMVERALLVAMEFDNGCGGDKWMRKLEA